MKKLFFFSLLALVACKKTDDKPRGASNGGESYMSCKINGKQYTFTGEPVGLNPTGASYNYINVKDLDGNFYSHYVISGDDLEKQLASVYIDLSSDTSYRFPSNTRISFSDLAKREVYVLLRSQ